MPHCSASALFSTDVDLLRLRGPHEAMGALCRHGGELAAVDACLEMQELCLAHEWHQLKVAINLGQLQHECDKAKAAAVLAASCEASARALEEAKEADHHCESAEKREHELLALNAALEKQIKACRTVLALMSRVPFEEKEILKREEALALEALEHGLEHERLEMRELHVAMTEDDVSAREARI